MFLGFSFYRDASHILFCLILVNFAGWPYAHYIYLISNYIAKFPKNPQSSLTFPTTIQLQHIIKSPDWQLLGKMRCTQSHLLIWKSKCFLCFWGKCLKTAKYAAMSALRWLSLHAPPSINPIGSRFAAPSQKCSITIYRRV